jgi:sigma-B regulation protein RsbU (phosphoserine phosphatase)
VGDVAGKGSAAALYGTLGVGMLREHAAHHHCPPEEMLANLNERLHAPGGESQFIALAFGTYRMSTRELVLANAGFPRPLLVRQGKATAIEVAGIPVGMLPGTRYDAARLTLQPGDVLVFCSDGVHEQTNRLGEEFGLGRLLDRLATTREGCSAESIAEDIRRAVEEYAPERAGCEECSDDRTIVVLRVQE